MKTILLLASLLVSSAALGAQTDFQCVQNCTASGSLYNFCLNKCSYASPYETQAPSRPVNYDWACMNRCSGAGYAYGFCQSRCSE